MIAIREFTDPTCPWAFSAEPSRLRLLWLYGEGLRFERRMIVLSESGDEYVAQGVDPPAQADAMATIQRDYGMPIVSGVAPRMLATVVPCRAVVAVRLHSPEHEMPLLRRLATVEVAEVMNQPADEVRRALTDLGATFDPVGPDGYWSLASAR